MMGSRITKIFVSLKLVVPSQQNYVNWKLINTFIYPRITVIIGEMVNSQKYEFKTIFFHLNVLTKGFSLNITFPLIKLYRYLPNLILIEGTISQNFDLGLTFCFISKYGKLSVNF